MQRLGDDVVTHRTTDGQVVAFALVAVVLRFTLREPDLGLAAIARCFVNAFAWGGSPMQDFHSW